jgi:hypothetical protein
MRLERADENFDETGDFGGFITAPKAAAASLALSIFDMANETGVQAFESLAA